MREFPFNISESLKRGLRPEKWLQEPEHFLEVCYGMSPEEGGCSSYLHPEDPFDGGVSVDVPFPQLFRAAGTTVMLSATTLSSVNVGVSPWSLSGVSTFDVEDFTVEKAITAGGQWHFVDLREAWYAFNENCTVFQTGLDRLVGEAPRVLVQDGVTIKTGCEYKGRVYLGGFDSSDVWDSFWTDLFTTWESEAGLSELSLGPNGPGTNWVMYSSIGGGDFPLWLFWPKGYSQLGLGPSQEAVISRMKRNELGWAPLPMNGTVQVMKPLGNFVIVYGDEGIQALVPQGNRLGFQTVADFGVLGRGAVGGDLRGHVFLDGEGSAWELKPDLNLIRLGYSEWFSGFPASSTALTMRQSPREIFACSPDEGYVFTGNGLSEHTDRITSSVIVGGLQYAVGVGSSTTPIEVRTGKFDMRRQALKMVHDIQVAYDAITDLAITVYFRYSRTEAFQTLGPTLVNDEGVVTFTVTGLEFKIALTGVPSSGARIDGVEVRWNLVDHRAVRGIYAPE